MLMMYTCMHIKALCHSSGDTRRILTAEAWVQFEGTL
jgi:hypothetical protein